MKERMIKNKQLNEQKRSVLIGIASSKTNVSNLKDKISRLEEASNHLNTSISELDSLKSSILGLSIDQSKWDGEEYTNFAEAYSTYEETVKSYVSRTEDAKDAIDEDIKRYRTTLDTSITGLNNLESALTGLDKEIAQL